MAVRKDRANSVERDAKGKFLPGNPGKPRGARHRATLKAQELLDGQAQALTSKAVEMALGGDSVALRLCLERLVPVKRDAPIQAGVNLPDDPGQALTDLIQRVTAGEITPGEAEGLTKLIEAKVRVAELKDIEERLTALEGREGK